MKKNAKKTKDVRNYASSSTNERNIIVSKRVKPYRVFIIRDRQKFTKYVDTIEEGVKIRDRALNYYRRNGRLPKDISELQISKDFSKSKRSNRKIDRNFCTQASCSRCGIELKFTNKESFRRFEKSGNLCKDCIKDNRRKSSDYTSDSMKYISWHKTSNLYMVSIERRGRKILIYQPTIEDAKIAREKIENFYDEHLRLPTREEAIEDLGIEVLRTGRDLELKNIAVLRNGHAYVAHLSRNNTRHSKTFYDLESAKAYRDYLYEFYEQHDRLPTKEESKRKVEEIELFKKGDHSLDA